MKMLLYSLILAVATAAPAQQPQQPPPQQQGADANEQQQRFIEMKLQRDQAAAAALHNALSNLSEYRDLLSLQAEIQQLTEQLQNLKAQAPHTTPPNMQRPINPTPPKK